MGELENIFQELEKCNFLVSTDTRKDVRGTIYFALKGEAFDGSAFVHQALEKGAVAAVTSNSALAGERVFVVENVLKTLQEVAKKYRETFSIPIVVIGGSNGKTTTRELTTEILRTKYRTHSSKENLNNHIGVPLSILSMVKDTEVGVFEIGANHPGEHLVLLDILQPTMVLVTNNGLDHLEGFGSPEGGRKANKEIYDWAREYNTKVLVDKNQPDLIKDSEGLDRALYPNEPLQIISSLPLTFTYKGQPHATHLVGDYNVANISAALAIGKVLEVSEDKALEAVSLYQPSLKRSQYVETNGINIVLDCYNANPSSMKLSLESFLGATPHPRGVVLGDMLELGSYATAEHEKVLKLISNSSLDQVVLVGEHFKDVLPKDHLYHWFPNAEAAREWFTKQDFKGWTFLLKGSRGVKIERVLSL